ncbi:MFS transporter [Deinococcus altitudinis]|uniref:MFS transporter n=1 Tax=Deinococcus altitudinis TaxID=468914 RepID=UPI003891C989
MPNVSTSGAGPGLGTQAVESPDPVRTALPGWLSLLLAAACGLIVANIYYAQPLVGPISVSLGVPVQLAGLIVTLTQVGYGLGLLFIVPLGDLIENRRLILTSVSLSALALLGAAVSVHPLPLLIAALFIGLGSVAVQVLVPYAAHLAPEASRGRAVGNVMSGLTLGIMLARPVASLVTQLSSWHLIFYLSAALMVLLGGVLWRALPPRVPEAGLHYGSLMASMRQLAWTTPVLQRRALYQAALFAAFSLFWTTVPLLLAGPVFRLSQVGIALFALAGVAGAVAAPIAGRMADRGWTRPATGLALLMVALAFSLTRLSLGGGTWALGLLVVMAIALDYGVTTNLTLGQRAIFMLSAEHRSRLNGLFMATFFIAGAVGSAVGGWAYTHGGWSLVAWIGTALPVAALLYFVTEKRV